MPLSAGTRLGHYDVTALVGEGGMGEVWQARGKTVDKELQRLVPHAGAIASAWHVPVTFLLSGLGGSWQPVATVWEDRQDA